MRWINGFQPRPNLDMDCMEEVVAYLFPIHPKVRDNFCDNNICDINQTVNCENSDNKRSVIEY